MNKLNDRIQKISESFDGDKKLFNQDCISFGELEKAMLVSLKRKLDIPKSRTIAVACKYLLEELEKEEKQDDKDKTDGKK